jgi:methylenetetrahydrofolate dehydrogenase (NADP+)/methenyltetrahydrofolate cyclohydrolase
MLVDGNKIAEELLKAVSLEVASFERVPKLAVITCSPNFETKKYLEMKTSRSAQVGIFLNVIELPAEASTQDVIDCLIRVAEDSDGIVVQLPLPPHIDRDLVLNAVPVEKDPDGFQFGLNKNACLSPVVGAIDEISTKYKIDWSDKNVVILGEGRLVGLPSYHYAKNKNAKVKILTKENFTKEILKEADIIVSGIGQPRFITSDFVKEGVVIFDAGTSEDGGILVGDVSPEVVDKASLLTPVPGGIGPITIAYLLRNLVRLVRQ